MPDTKKKSATDYNSYFCPKILLRNFEDLRDMWPNKLNVAKFGYLAVAYMLQQNIKPKEVIIDDEVETERVMIRVTSDMLEAVKELLRKEKIEDKTDVYIAAFTHFLRVFEGILEDLRKCTFAEGPENKRIIVKAKKLKELFPENGDYEKLIVDSFSMGEERLLIVPKEELLSLRVSKLFKADDSLDSRKLWKRI